MREYVFKQSFASPGAVTLLQLVPAAAVPIVLIRAWLNSTDQTTSAQREVQILRKTAAATVTAATTAADGSSAEAPIVPLDPRDKQTSVQLGTALSGHTATAEGTQGAVLVSDGFNVVSGWLWLPVPEERITVPGGGFIALRTPTALPAGNYRAGIVYAEIG